MPTNPECIITGVVLVIDDTARPADLFEMGDIYIVNASGEGYPLPLAVGVEHRNSIDLTNAPYFERRNVFVVHRSQAKLNANALAYIANAR